MTSGIPWYANIYALHNVCTCTYNAIGDDINSGTFDGEYSSDIKTMTSGRNGHAMLASFPFIASRRHNFIYARVKRGRNCHNNGAICNV